MGPAAGAIGAAAVGGLLSSKGASKAASKANRANRANVDPQNNINYMSQVNPGFHGAFYNNSPGSTGYQQAWYDKIHNPGQFSSYPYTQGMQGLYNSFTAAAGKLGRANIGAQSGLGRQGFTMANAAQKNQIGQQYGMLRQQQMDKDLQLVQGALGQGVGWAQGQPTAPAQPVMGTGGQLGLGLGAGLNAYGGYKQMQNNAYNPGPYGAVPNNQQGNAWLNTGAGQNWYGGQQQAYNNAGNTGPVNPYG